MDETKPIRIKIISMGDSEVGKVITDSNYILISYLWIDYAALYLSLVLLVLVIFPELYY